VCSSAVIVIPTYNEAATAPRLVQCLFSSVITGIRHWKISVLVVDGNSPDGTAERIREIQPRYPGLHLLIEREKEGLGAAYYKGFEYAIRHLMADVLIEFDGDFQHPPEAIPRLLEQIDQGADFVLASRRIRGGCYPASWGLKRLLLSKLGGLVARLLLFFPSRDFFRVTDPTTGLRATRVAGCYERLDFSTFRDRGFGYKVEMLYHIVKMGARTREIPLKFGLRQAGDSKITAQTPKEILCTALRLRWFDETSRRFLRFAIVGLSGFLINSITLELFVRANFVAALAGLFRPIAYHPTFGFVANSSAWAGALAAECAILSNYLWNNFWTFARYKALRFGEFLVNGVKFNLTSFGAILLQFLSIGFATFLIANTRAVRQVCLVLTICLVIIPYNWLMYNHVIWQTHRPEKGDSEK